MRDAVVSELSDTAGTVQDLNQQYSFNGVAGSSSIVAGSGFDDMTDHCDTPDDVSGEADNLVMFDVVPANEVPPIPTINFGFEDGIDPADANRTFGAAPNPRVFLFDANDVLGWQTTAADNQIEIWESGFGGVVSQNGNYHAEINANVAAQLYQDFNVTPGTTIQYSIWHRGRTGVDVANVMIGVPGAPAVDQTMSTGNGAWANYTGSYTVPTGISTLRIGFESVSSSNGNPSFGNFIDELQVQVVP